MDQIIDTTLSFFRESVEWKGFGWNLFTLSFLIVFWEGLSAPWALWHQNRTVWRASDVSGMSVPTRLALCAFYVAAFNYGLAINSAALYVVAPILIPFHVAIAIGLFRANGGFTVIQWLFAIVCVWIAVASFVPALTVLIYGFIGIAFIPFNIGQPIKMWKNQSTAGVNPREPFIQASITLAWTIYGLFIGSWVISLISGVYFLTHCATLALYFRFRAPAPRST